MEVVVLHREARLGAVGGDAVTVEGETRCGRWRPRNRLLHGPPRDGDPVAVAVAVVPVQVAAGDDVAERVSEIDAPEEAGDLAVAHHEPVVPEDRDSLAGPRLVGDHSHKLQPLEGHVVALDPEEAQVRVFRQAHGGEGRSSTAGRSARPARPPPRPGVRRRRRRVRLRSMTTVPVKAYSPGRQEQGVPGGGRVHGLLNRLAGEALHLQARSGPRLAGAGGATCAWPGARPSIWSSGSAS